jgi:uncharacterized protein
MDQLLNSEGFESYQNKGSKSGVEIILVNEKVGLGVKTNRAHERGTIVEHFSGVVGPYTLQHTLQLNPFQHILDLKFVGYLSHSCDPNCVLDMHRLCVLAAKDIDEGDILTIDYAVTEDQLFKQFACTCGAANCRRWVTGRRETVNEKGKRFLGRQRVHAA